MNYFAALNHESFATFAHHHIWAFAFWVSIYTGPRVVNIVTWNT